MDNEKLLETAMRLETLQRDNGLTNFVDQLQQLIRAKDMLITRFSPLKVGDRAVLTKTPEITRDISPGWYGSKHFLVEGRGGVITDVEVYNGKFRYGFQPDNQTWINFDKKEAPLDRPHQYSFFESWLIQESLYQI